MDNTNKIKSASSETVVRSGLGFLEALTLLFIALKLCGVISWSWWWVLAPLWMPIALVLLILVVGLVGVLIWYLAKGRKSDGQN